MATQTRGDAAEKRSGAGRAAKREGRTTPALFFRQMVGELRKVIWPTRSMLVTYTVVCMVFVVFMVIIVTSLDYGFTKLVFALFGGSAVPGDRLGRAGCMPTRRPDRAGRP